jgi:hypothetical protein
MHVYEHAKNYVCVCACVYIYIYIYKFWSFADSGQQQHRTNCSVEQSVELIVWKLCTNMVCLILQRKFGNLFSFFSSTSQNENGVIKHSGNRIQINLGANAATLLGKQASFLLYFKREQCFTLGPFRERSERNIHLP